MASSPSFGYTTHDKLAALPNSLLTITLTSNFGTFILYALSCFLCIVAYHERPDHNFLVHTLIPGFGLLANLVCMGFYLTGPFFNLGTKMEPLCALGISLIWGIVWSHLLPPFIQGKGKNGSARIEKRSHLAVEPTETETQTLGGISEDCIDKGNHGIPPSRLFKFVA